jgi:hypothetical protein
MNRGVAVKPAVRERLVILLALSLTLTACGKPDSGQDSPSAPVGAEIVMGSTALTLDENRLVFVLRDGVARYADARSVQVRLRELPQADNPVVWEGQAARHMDTEGAYWVAYPEFSHTGQWLFDFVVVTTGGARFTITLTGEVYERPIGLTVGMQAVPSETFTWHGEGDLAAVTTDATPVEAYYRQTVAEAVTGGRPSLIIFATPGLCTRKLCGPVLDSIDPLYAAYHDRMNFVHVETYNLATGEKVPAIAEWGLLITPWLFLVDADGRIVYRCEGVFSAEELTPIIESMLNRS